MVSSGPRAVLCSSVLGLTSNEVQLAYLLFWLGKRNSKLYAEITTRICHLARVPGVDL